MSYFKQKIHYNKSCSCHSNLHSQWKLESNYINYQLKTLTNLARSYQHHFSIYLEELYINPNYSNNQTR